MNRLKQDWKSTLKTVGTYSFQLAVIIEVILVILDKSEFCILLRAGPSGLHSCFASSSFYVQNVRQNIP